MRSLAFQIYLFSVMAVLVTIGAHIASFMAFHDGHGRDLDATSQALVAAMTRAAADPDPARRTEIRALLRHPGPVQGALYAPDGTLLLATHDAPPPLPTADVRARLAGVAAIELDGRTFARAVRQGDRLTAIGVVRLISPPITPLLASLGAMLVLTVAFARYLSGPLRRITAAARRFGAGETGARAELGRRDEIGAVGRAFDDTADRVVMLMRSQQTLMANVSHELRTPLARIRVALDLLVDGVEPQAAIELLPGVLDDLGDLERLIDDVMIAARFDLSQAGAHPAGVPLQREPTVPAALVDDAARRFRAGCGTHPLRLEVPDDLPTIEVDRVLVGRAIGNLLQNARRYSDAGRTIRLSVAAAGGEVRFQIADEGVGMTADEVRQAFTPFFRGDASRSRASGGTGLGLALVQQVVRAHGGEITLDSAPGAGTRAVFTLPVDGP